MLEFYHKFTTSCSHIFGSVLSTIGFWQASVLLKQWKKSVYCSFTNSFGVGLYTEFNALVVLYENHLFVRL